MRLSRRRIRAIVVKELRDYRRNRTVIGTTAILPLVFMIQPLVAIFVVKKAASVALRHEHSLLYLLAIPALVPAALAAASIVAERQQGTLEPVLTTPIRREEFVIAKALAPLIPTVAIGYVVYGLFLILVALFAAPGIPSALIRAPDVIAQLVFTPLIAVWSIWVAIGISSRATDIRTAQQLSVLAALPLVALSTLVAENVIHASVRVAVIAAIALLALDRLGWRVVSRAFDRERLVTGTKG